MAAAWNDLPVSGGLNECGALVRSAEALRVSAPELAIQIARRALLIGATDASGTVAKTGEARALSMRAHAILAAGLVRVGQHTAAVEPGFAALELAETGGFTALAAEIRMDLAACAQEVGEPLLGGALLRPVLEAGQVPPSTRAAALGRLVGCVAHLARRDDVEDALSEADRLLAADDSLSPDARRMERARLAVRSAVYHRWYGDNEDAVNVARDGLVQLDRLRREARSESDRLRARLVLELVCALLDEGEPRDAATAAAPTVDEPVRATSASAVGQLMLALATRVHVPAGDVERGRSLLDQAAWLAERHGLDSVLADALTEVSRMDEQAGRTQDALTALRNARAAEHRRMRSMARAARVILTEVGAGLGAKDVTQQAIAALLRQLAHPTGVPVAMAPLPPPRTSPEPQALPAAGELTGTVDDPPEPDVPPQEGGRHTDKGTGLLNREGLIRRIRSVRTGERPVSLTLLRFEHNNDEDRGPDTGIMAGLADKLRHLAPDNAELARPEGGELAVLMPDTTKDEAKEFADRVRETAMEGDWLADASGKDMSISTGVAQGDDTHADEAGILTAARDALTQAPPSALTEETPTRPRPETEARQARAEAAQPRSALSEETPTTPINLAESLPVGRSILSTLSIPSGSGGRRRAPGEPPPGEPGKARWPSEAAPKTTRAERRAAEQTTPEQPPAAATQTPPDKAGWPAEPDISQPLRPAKPQTAEARSSYEDTKAELAKMMSALNAKSRRPAPAKPQDDPNTTPGRRRAPEPPAPGDTDMAVFALGSPLGRRHAPDPTPSETATPNPEADVTGSAISHRNTPTEPEAAARQASDASGVDAADSVLGRRYAPESTPSEADQASGASGGVDAADLVLGRRYAPEPSPSEAAAAALQASDASGVDAADLVLGRRYALESTPSEADQASGASGGAEAGGRRYAPEPSSSEADAAALQASDASGVDAADSVLGRRYAPESSPSEAGQASGFSGGADAADSVLGRRYAPEPSPSEADAAALRASGVDAVDSVLGRRYEPGEGVGAGRRRAPESPDQDSASSSLGFAAEPTAADAAANERGHASDDTAQDATTPGAEAAPADAGVQRDSSGLEESMGTADDGPQRPRSGLMAAFDALSGPVPEITVDVDDAAELPSRKPAVSWAELETSSVVDSPADDLFGAPAEKPKSKFRSSLGAAFAEFGDEPAPAPNPAPAPAPAPKPAETPAYDEPIGPPPKPESATPRRERSATTIASLLTEALAAYQSGSEEDTPAPAPAPDAFDSFLQDSANRAAAHRDSAGPEETTRDAASRDFASLDAINLNSTARGAANWDSASRAPAGLDAISLDSTSRGAANQGAANWDSASRDVAHRDSASLDAVNLDSASQGAADWDSASRASLDATSLDSTDRGAVSQGTAHRDSAYRDAASRDSASRDAASRDSASRDAVSLDSTDRGAANQGATNWDAANLDAANLDSADQYDAQSRAESGVRGRHRSPE